MSKEPPPSTTNNDTGKAKTLPMVPVLAMFRFAEPLDYFLMLLGTIGAVGNGLALCIFSIIFGDILDTLNSLEPGDAGAVSVQLAYLGVGVWVAATLQIACWSAAAERMTIKMRTVYLDAILSQEIAYFDLHGTGSLASKIAENSILFRFALGEKLSHLFQYGCLFAGGIIVGFVYMWEITLVILAFTPFIGASAVLMASAMSTAVSGQLEAYERAGNISEETLRMIRTVTAFNMQSVQIDKYERELQGAAKKSAKQGFATGLGIGAVNFFFFLAFAVTFYVGGVLIVNSKNAAAERFPPASFENGTAEFFCAAGQPVPLVCSGGKEGIIFNTDADVCSCPLCRCGCYPSLPGEPYKLKSDCITGGDVILAFFAVLLGSFAIGQAAPSLTAFASGRAAAYMLYEVLDRKPTIDASNTGPGKQIDSASVKGEIRFENVTFKYPTRDQLVLKQLNMTIPAGQRVALVGESGSGKSTIIQLLERYYDPMEGSLYLDDIAYKDINLASLRRLIGLVSQEPALFATSVMENVRFGRPSATDEEVIEACKQANAHGFISTFPDAYQTFVNSSLVSGGQKQRLAIARALLRNPPILLLDEATAALDNESERLVNEAIDKLLLDARTTIVIAHRLSSIQTCDKIIVLDHGIVLEEGSPKELAEKENGHYAALLKLAKGGPQRQLTDARLEVLAAADREAEALRANRQDESPAPVEKDEEQQQPAEKPVAVEPEKQVKNYPLRRALEFSYPDRILFIPATFFACVDGLVFPMFGLMFSYFLATFFLTNNEDILNEARTWTLALFGLSVASGVAPFFEFLAYGYINGRTTLRARMKTFRHMLTMEMGYFDLKENNVGALTTKLGSDCGLLKAAVSDRLQLGTLNLATAVSGLIIAFVGSWKVALVTFALMPMLIVGGIIEMSVLTSAANTDQKSLVAAASTLTEAIGGIRTVAAFEMQHGISRLYLQQLLGPLNKAMKKGIVAGLGFGMSQGIIYFLYALAYWYGSTLVSAGEITFQELNQSLMGILMTAMALGQTIAMFPDVGKGQVAVNSIFGSLDRKSRIDPTNSGGLKPSVLVGDVSFENINFAYPSRPEVTVLDSFNLEIKRGQTVAFVGTSGSGKSTLVLLLERFYDPLEGSSVKIDGVDVRELNLEWLRSQIGIVSQEPSLFQGTIADNIRNGRLDATEEEVVEAAKQANCHDFIMSFPNGYQTEIQHNALSGGQKQRVCIARALLKQPKILLLDEATSALDEESQRVVQQALDAFLETSNRTTIVVAHRLTTIRNADVIVVLQHGVVVEQGSFEELSSKPDGAFQALLKAQEQ